MTRVADMQMTREKQVRAAFSQLGTALMAVRVQRDGPTAPGGARLGHPLRLPSLAGLAPRSDRASGCFAAKRRARTRQLFILVNRLEVIGNVALVFRKWLNKTGKHIMKRDVVISRHDYLRFWQRIQKRTRLLKLIRACALCKVAGDCDNVRLNFPDSFHQRIDQGRIDAAEMQVRQMNYLSHAFPSHSFCLFRHNHSQGA